MSRVEHISIAEYKKLTSSNRKSYNKFGNKRCVLDDIKFDSKAERDYYAMLLRRKMVGEVKDIGIHPKWTIYLNGAEICDVVLDFVFYDQIEKRRRFIDVKGHDNPLSKLKRKLLQAQYGHMVEVIPA